MEANETQDINYHVIGGTMVFYNSDQSISGEVRRSSNSSEIIINVENGILSDEEEMYLVSLYLKSGAQTK